MRIGILTSGGDSPGMNPCIAELVKQGAALGHELVGIRGGYPGILRGAFCPLDRHIVQPIYKLGGTVLGSGRLPEMRERSVQLQVLQALEKAGIEALMILGGDGSFRGAKALSDVGEGRLRFVGIPCTIDNDIFGSEYTLGYDTALNKLAAYIDDIMDTALALPNRVFLIETLGRDGRLAYSAEEMGLVDLSVMLERDLTDQQVCEKIRAIFAAGKTYVILSYSEKTARIAQTARYLERKLGCSVKCNMIGYQQRGGVPTAAERLFAAGFVREAYRALEDGDRDVYTVWTGGAFGRLPLVQAAQHKLFQPEIR